MNIQLLTPFQILADFQSVFFDRIGLKFKTETLKNRKYWIANGGGEHFICFTEKIQFCIPILGSENWKFNRNKLNSFF